MNIVQCLGGHSFLWADLPTPQFPEGRARCVHLQSAGVKQNLAERGSQHILVSTEHSSEARSARSVEAIGLAHLSSPGKETRAGDSQHLVCQDSELPAHAAVGSTTPTAWQETTLVSPDSPQAVSTARHPQGACDARLVLTPASQTAHQAPVAPKALSELGSLTSKEIPCPWVRDHHNDCKILFPFSRRAERGKAKKQVCVCVSVCVSVCVCVSSSLCPTLCYPMACSPPGSSIHGLLQARILE